MQTISLQFQQLFFILPEKETHREIQTQFNTITSNWYHAITASTLQEFLIFADWVDDKTLDIIIELK